MRHNLLHDRMRKFFSRSLTSEMSLHCSHNSELISDSCALAHYPTRKDFSSLVKLQGNVVYMDAKLPIKDSFQGLAKIITGHRPF